ncbi:MAG: 1,4-alpha-glucan branching protein GlgB, partial [Pseudomonadota bacterium]
MPESKANRKSSVPPALRRFAKGHGHDAASVLGAHPLDGDVGFRFCLWAPNAREVWVEGDFDSWRGRAMQREGAFWTVDVAEARAGQLYKFAVLGADGIWRKKADPFAAMSELRPGDASRLFVSRHRWRDAAWMRGRAARQAPDAPISIYELHAGSWMRDAEGGF